MVGCVLGGATYYSGELTSQLDLPLACLRQVSISPVLFARKFVCLVVDQVSRILRPYQIKLMFHGSVDSVFVMSSKKKLNFLSSISVSNLGVRLCGYWYVVSLPD